MKRSVCSILVLGGLLVAGTAQAQIFTPTYTSPRLTNDIGIYLNSGPGDLGVEGIWRGGPLGLRVGWVDAAGGMLSVGGEVRSPLHMGTAPLGLALTLGAQGLIGDDGAFGAHAGLTAGYSFLQPGVAITPYIHPRVALVNDLGPSSDARVRVLADVGVDVELSNSLIFRLGVGLADVGTDVGFGVAIRR